MLYYYPSTQQANINLNRGKYNEFFNNSFLLKHLLFIMDKLSTVLGSCWSRITQMSSVAYSCDRPQLGEAAAAGPRLALTRPRREVQESPTAAESVPRAVPTTARVAIAECTRNSFKTADKTNL